MFGMKIVPDEVKPLTGYSVPALLLGISERYKLVTSPTLQEANSVGAKFKNGRWKDINITELAIFNDSMHATTSDTSDSELVISDLYDWLKANFGFRDPITKQIKAYQSDLIVEFESDPQQIIESFGPLVELLQKEAASINGVDKPVQFNRLDFGSDPLLPGPNAVFLIERRAGAAYAENRFFCKAYMRTEAHLRALNLLDKLLGKKKR